METLGINLSEKPFYDIADHDLLDVWESDIGSVRKIPVVFAFEVVAVVVVALVPVAVVFVKVTVLVAALDAFVVRDVASKIVLAVAVVTVIIVLFKVTVLVLAVVVIVVPVVASRIVLALTDLVL